MTNLPSTSKRWKLAVGTSQLQIDTIHSFENPLSASKITLQQFLLLQILWAEATLKAPGDLLQPQCYAEAKKHLKGAKFWKHYLDSLKTHGTRDLGIGAFPEMGTFSLVRHYQVLCDKIDVMDVENCSPKFFSPVSSRTRSADYLPPPPLKPFTPTPSGRFGLRSAPHQSQEDKATDYITKWMSQFTVGSPGTPESSSSASKASEALARSPAAYQEDLPAVNDEQIVNAALLLFLTAVTFHFDVAGDWSMHRERFQLGESGKKIFEARVDGYLRSRLDHQVKAIIEVKPFTRTEDLNGIRMQEGAQMAAWISNYPEKKRKPKEQFR